jgi:hypothetical protein
LPADSGNRRQNIDLGWFCDARRDAIPNADIGVADLVIPQKSCETASHRLLERLNLLSSKIRELRGMRQSGGIAPKRIDTDRL